MDLTQQLHRAIHAGLMPEVQRLVSEGAKLDHVLGMRGTALCAAIEARNLEMVRYIIQAGCDVNVQDYDGEPPLLLALRKDSPGQILGRRPSLDIARLLIDNEKCNINIYDKLTKKTALHFVAEQGMDEVAKWLMTAACKCDVNAVDRNGNSALHLAVHDGHYKVVEVLISNPSCQLKIYNKAGMTPLHICTNNGDCNSLHVLIKRLQKTSKGDSLLELETSTGRVHESELTINLDAPTIYEKETCLHLACRNYHVDIVKSLLKNCAKVDCANNCGNTPLLLSLTSTKHWQTNDNEIPGLLLRKGANPNICSAVRCVRYLPYNTVVTPLIVAAIKDNEELAKLLVKHGADVNATDDYDQTALYHALSENAKYVAVFLIRDCPGINVNFVTKFGSTCLHAVVKYCAVTAVKDHQRQREMVIYLLCVGATLLKDGQGNTAIDIALQHENHNALDALLEGTKTNPKDLTYSPDNTSILAVTIAEGYLDLVKVLLAHGADINQTFLDTTQSMLYIALFNREYKIAQYLVENGLNLKQEHYIFKEERAPVNGPPKKTTDTYVDDEEDSAEDSNDEEDESDDSGSDYCSDSDSDSENFDVFRGNKTFKRWLQGVASSPRTLQLTCLTNIRTYLMDKNVQFHEIETLPLPQALRNKLRYR